MFVLFNPVKCALFVLVVQNAYCCSVVLVQSLRNVQPFNIRLLIASFAEGCSPSTWTGYDGEVCGSCSALVKVTDNGGTCMAFCQNQGLTCSNAWDDTTNNQCSNNAPKLGCSHTFSGTSDGICECTSTSTLQHASCACTVTWCQWHIWLNMLPPRILAEHILSFLCLELSDDMLFAHIRLCFTN